MADLHYCKRPKGNRSVANYFPLIFSASEQSEASILEQFICQIEDCAHFVRPINLLIGVPPLTQRFNEVSLRSSAVYNYNKLEYSNHYNNIIKN